MAVMDNATIKAENIYKSYQQNNHLHENKNKNKNTGHLKYKIKNQ